MYDLDIIDKDIHARFSPSKLPRIITCPASVKASEELEKLGVVTVQSDSAKEGSFLHGVTADHLTRDIYEISDQLSEDKTKNLDYTFAVNEVLSHVFSLKAALTSDYTEYIESRISCKEWADFCGTDLVKDVEGVLDYGLSYDRTLIIKDWKYGKGVQVDPSSDQLLGYVLGALRNPSHASKYDRVICGIGQPRIGDGLFPEIEYSVQDVLRWAKHVLSPALQKVEANPPIFNPTEDACRFCPARHRCPARHKRAHELASKAFELYIELPNLVDIEELSNFLSQAGQLELYIKDLKKYAMQRLLNGQEFPGYKLTRGRSNRIWKDEQETLLFLEQAGYEAEDISVVKLFSPAQVEKVISKDLKKSEAFLDLIDRPEGAIVLSDENDPKDAIKILKPEQVFAAYALSNDSED